MASPPAPDSDFDSHTDGIDLTGISDSGLTQTWDSLLRAGQGSGSLESLEANIILIAHPEGHRLGSRYRLTPGAELEIGRSSASRVSLPEVLSISRHHARLFYDGGSVVLEDLESTNGTYLNGRLVMGRQVVTSGDRFQVGAVHFKLLHEKDVEHAYYEAIYELVTRDGLTEIYNKRKYDEEAERELARAIRHERPLALILFDLDDFKGINDRFGHLCGDFVLKEVATTVGEVLRPEQVFARVGGDEFVILTPETGVEGARILAEKLRRRVAELDFVYADVAVPLTCSFGVAQLTPAMAHPTDLYEEADRALYRSKDAGRNRVTAASVAELLDADSGPIPLPRS